MVVRRREVRRREEMVTLYEEHKKNGQKPSEKPPKGVTSNKEQSLSRTRKIWKIEEHNK